MSLLRSSCRRPLAATTLLLAAVRNFGGLVALRFFLGAFESGLFPGQVYFLTFWYRPEERAVRIALIVACSSLGGAFGGAIAMCSMFMVYDAINLALSFRADEDGSVPVDAGVVMNDLSF